MKDEKLIAGIKEGGSDLEQSMKWLYHTSSICLEIRSFFNKKGESAEDTEDILQDAICALIINVRQDRFKGDSSVKTYLFAIANNLWVNRTRRKIKLRDIKGNIMINSIDYNTPITLLLDQEDRQQLDILLSKLGNRCQEILQLWSLNYSMLEIAQNMGYKSAGMARKKKHMCMKKLVAIAKKII